MSKTTAFTITDDDATIERALQDASIPTLLMSMVHMSGDASLLDSLIGRIAPGGEIVLAGFYSERLSFAFPPAFMREARIRIAAQWQPDDLVATRALIESGKLSLDGLITHRHDAMDAPNAYRTTFNDPACLKMVLNWSAHS